MENKWTGRPFSIHISKMYMFMCEMYNKKFENCFGS